MVLSTTLYLLTTRPQMARLNDLHKFSRKGTKLSRFLLKYRIAPHTETGVAPGELLIKRRLRTHLNQVQPRVVEHVENKQFQQMKVHNQHAKERIIKAGDNVLMRDFRKCKSWQKGIVVKLTRPVLAQVQLDNGQTVRRHLDHIWKCCTLNLRMKTTI